MPQYGYGYLEAVKAVFATVPFQTNNATGGKP